MEETVAQLAAKGFVITRPPIDQQWRKSRQKRALLKSLYGPTGQPIFPKDILVYLIVLVVASH